MPRIWYYKKRYEWMLKWGHYQSPGYGSVSRQFFCTTIVLSSWPQRTCIQVVWIAGISTESFITIVWCQVHPGIHGSHTRHDCKIVGWDCRLYLLALLSTEVFWGGLQLQCTMHYQYLAPEIYHGRSVGRVDVYLHEAVKWGLVSLVHGIYMYACT